MDQTNTSTRVFCGEREFLFASGAHEIIVVQPTEPGVLTIPCPSDFTHSDLPAFARGWTYCKVYG